MLQYRTNAGERRKPAIGRFGELTVEQARSLAQDWLADVRKAATRELVDHAQHAERPAILGPILHEVVGPDVVGPLRPQPHARAVVEPQTAPFRLLLRHFKPFPSPDPP